MNLNEVLALLALIGFMGLLAAGFFIHSKPIGDWTKLLSWNVAGLLTAVRRRHYK